MKTVGNVVLVLFASVLLLLALPYTLSLCFDGEIKAYVGVGPIRVSLAALLGKKKKNPRVVPFADAAFGSGAAIPEKRKKRRKAAENAPKDGKSASAKTQKGSSDANKPPITDRLTRYRDILFAVIGLFGGHGRFRLKRCRLVAASPQADTTAYIFAAMNGFAALLTEYFGRLRHARTDKNAVAVYSDFLSEKPRADVCVCVTAQGFLLLTAAAKAFAAYNNK